MPTPTTYASARQYIGLAVETVAGTAVVPAVTLPVDKFDPQDMPTWLDDKALRGSMTDPYNRVQGVLHSEWSMSGPAYFDTLPYLLSNILGDNVYSGTYTGSGTTTLSSSASAGATTISTAASISASTVIQVDTGTLAEVRTVSSVSGTGPFTLTLNTALRSAHNSAVAVKPVTTPYQVVSSVLNTGTGQPSSLTITDYQGPTTSTGTRAYPGSCLSELSLRGTVESSTVEYDAKGLGWPSVPAAAFTSAPSSVLPQASWESQVGLAGTIGGAQIKTVLSWEFNITRDVKPYYTGQNSQNPYSIYRGKAAVTGKLQAVVADETFLTYLNSNTQPQLQLLVSNGLSGANLLSLQFDVQNAAFTTSSIDRSNSVVEYAATWTGIATTTNAGYSGGFSPIAVTVNNAVAPNTY